MGKTQMENSKNKELPTWYCHICLLVHELLIWFLRLLCFWGLLQLLHSLSALERHFLSLHCSLQSCGFCCHLYTDFQICFTLSLLCVSIAPLLFLRIFPLSISAPSWVQCLNLWESSLLVAINPSIMSLPGRGNHTLELASFLLRFARGGNCGVWLVFFNEFVRIFERGCISVYSIFFPFFFRSFNKGVCFIFRI